MKTVTVTASKTYDVVIGSGMLAGAGRIIRGAAPRARSVMIVSDDIVFPLYGGILRKSLEDAGFAVHEFVFPNGERSKNLATYGALMEKLSECGFRRTDAVAALGGGVVGDLGGFAAATYQRGITVVQLPTTLLAAVDSSVGGKTGVDLESGKNQVGCFWQPSAVICDTDVFSTLPDEQFLCGCGEVIKYGVIGDEPFFAFLEKENIKDHLEYVIEKCVAAKRDIVARDEFDTGERMLLNFGHTLGHAAEKCSGYTLPHGCAVAMGMAAVTRAAASMGLCDTETLDRLLGILKKYSLPTEFPYDAQAVTRTVMSDKKLLSDTLNIVYPKRIGECAVKGIPSDAAADWVRMGGIR